jgi:hypothetical protein
MNICVPTQGPEDWKRFLARESHWKEGYSAMALAQSWETHVNEGRGCPPEIGRLLFPISIFLAIPEYKVYLPPLDGRPSQTDLLAIGSEAEGLVAVTVEGKVNETFGPTLDERRQDATPGFDERIAYILALLKLPATIPGTTRYQLLHRTVAALHAATQFKAYRAVVLVHSFSQAQPHGAWFEDFHAFGRLFGADLEPECLESVGTFHGIEIDLAWCRGEERFLRRLMP